MKQSAPQSAPQSALPPGVDLLAALDSHFAERLVMTGDDGSRVACRIGGTRGPIIVLLHGISSGAASWLPCASLLAAHARVIAWDAPGYGHSSPLPMPAPNAHDYAKRLEAMLAALQVRPDLIVGHSLGALMAAGYAAHASTAMQPARLLLLSPALGYGAPGKEETSREVARQRIAALETQGVEGLAQRGPTRLLSPSATPDAQAWVRWNMQKLNPDGYRQAVALLCGDDIGRYLEARARPVEVGCGTQDVVTTPAASAALAERFCVPFHAVADAGHACYVEQPQAVARLIRSTLSQT
ncbi:alpha/beta fold hydrolase [Cupriavidus pauculus]|uniref:Alpha/beta hydrolase n=1 Tax=Cupriavidus pauculus TaxID=82633 RepID=A0A2N5CB04_9BURK|nr:alpha/beta hydrolase [Cupriavidus pauculus]PLP99399.1 alpha/beta hydrolase [Cupriavidus pauculus]